ncbi:ATP-binding cassette domain-containing protein [uncultured Muribaculum sp.]|uniref:metal ABC transporter ATP-binding protein n=1 Tax=uncultured Muribaculum sp. TaxID=1918613 RepID=UPI002591B834|nr:ATP-binding cassette domain-containing protein [uncultured Muribaculum sp.]
MLSHNNSLITLQHVSMRYDRRAILKDIDLEIKQGDFLAVTGPNGGGKTTLLRILLKLLKPTAGSVNYSFTSPTDRQPIGYLPQKNLIDHRFPITVKEVINLGLMAVKNLTKQEKETRLAETVELLGLADHADSIIGEISGGQLQRTLFGRAIISRPQMLVLDEPLSYLDKHYEKKMYEIIESLMPSTTFVLVSHEMSTIAEMANRHIIIDRSLHECCASHHFARLSCED